MYNVYIIKYLIEVIESAWGMIRQKFKLHE